MQRLVDDHGGGINFLLSGENATGAADAICFVDRFAAVVGNPNRIAILQYCNIYIAKGSVVLSSYCNIAIVVVGRRTADEVNRGKWHKLKHSMIATVHIV
jgi:hypothetical protein